MSSYSSTPVPRKRREAEGHRKRHEAETERGFTSMATTSLGTTTSRASGQEERNRWILTGGLALFGYGAGTAVEGYFCPQELRLLGFPS